MISLFSPSLSRRVRFVLCGLLLLVAFILSISFGQTSISLSSLVDAMFNYDASNVEHIIIHTDRLSRALTATLVGAGLAVSGCLVQVLTRNSLASPSLLGINSGALFFVVLGVSLFTLSDIHQLIGMAFLGAVVSATLVYILGAHGSSNGSPLKMILAGTAISALFLSCTQALLIVNNENMESVLFWLAGSVSNSELTLLSSIWPFFLVAALLTVFLTPHINILMLEEDVAKGLGQNVTVIKIFVAICAVVFAAGAVAIAGLIGFIGLIIPHISRRFFGVDQRWLLPANALLGGSLLLLADTLSRFIMSPQELPVGVMTALLGTPFFVYLARKGNTNNG